jgi:hypothetical protein
MVRPKKGRRLVARKLPANEMKKLLLKNGRLIKSARAERTTVDKFVYEINISRTQMIKYEAGGNMLLSTFLKLLHGLDINIADFFSELQNTDK